MPEAISLRLHDDHVMLEWQALRHGEHRADIGI